VVFHCFLLGRTRDDAPELEPCPETGDLNLDGGENIAGVDKFLKVNSAILSCILLKFLANCLFERYKGTRV
jgi:hypothetical protein